MKHFINLTSRIINKQHIIEIVKSPSKYYIYMNNNNLSGFTLFSIGSLSTNNNIIEICEKTNKQDYDVITDLINKINKIN